MKVNYEVEYLQMGQPRAYADSIYEAKIKVISEGIFNSDPEEEMIKRYANILVHNFEGTKPQLGKCHLEEIKKLEKGYWYVKIVYPYDD